MRTPLRVFYNCSNCPAYCCSYPRIIVNNRDIRRLARHNNLTEGEARKRFTKQGDEAGERIMRHKPDEHFVSVCRWLDSETRQCTIYHARPEICRAYPGTVRCGYYDFLMSERMRLEDDELVATTDNGKRA